MNGYRFYLEHATPSAKRRRHHAGTVVAIIPTQSRFQDGQIVFDAVGSVYDVPDSPVTSTGAAQAFLSRNCRRISESKARTIHPTLFNFIDP